MPKEKDCLNNAVKNCCAHRTGEDNFVNRDTDIKLRRRIGVKIFGIILSALVVFFNYSPRMRAVRALPKAVFINSVSTSNDTDKDGTKHFDSVQSTLSMLESASTEYGREGALNVTESGDETLGTKRISARLFNLFELAICLNIAKDSEKELFTFVQESSKFCFIKKKNCDHPVLYICYLPINKLCMINLTSFVFIGTSINIIRCKKLTQYIP